MTIYKDLKIEMTLEQAEERYLKNRSDTFYQRYSQLTNEQKLNRLRNIYYIKEKGKKNDNIQRTTKPRKHR